MSAPRYILLDRDGTIIVHHNYLADFRQVELLPRAAEGLRMLKNKGWGLIVVTNQSGLGRGYFRLEDLESIHRRMIALLDHEGVALDGIFFCPHTPEDDCQCRKPRSGLVELAVSQLGFDPSQSYVIGDSSCDIELGRQIGAKTMLVRSDRRTEIEFESQVTPDYIVSDLLEAAEVICHGL